MTIFRFSALVVSAALCGCASINPLAGTQLTTGFPERAMEVNDAYREERNAQILINILRARDRQDRKYTSLSDLKLTPSADVNNTAKVSGLELGGNLPDPWGVVEGSRTAGNKTNLELTISPNAKSDAGSIYRTPITQDQFQFYWNSGWSKDLVVELMVAKATPLYLASGGADNQKVLKGIGDARRGFRVFAGDGELAHCFANEQCTMEEQKTEPPKPGEDKKEKTYQFSLKERLATAVSIPPGDRLPEPELAKLMASPGGRLLFCRRESGEMPVVFPGASSPKVREVYRCGFEPISPAACSKLDKDGNCEQGRATSLPVSVFFVLPDRGIYTLALNSIDDAIYKVGRSLRSYDRGDNCLAWMEICSRASDVIYFNSDDEETVRRANAKAGNVPDETRALIQKANERKVPLFALATKESLQQQQLGRCAARFAASVTYSDGATYYAGPPQAFAHQLDDDPSDDQKSKDHVCYLQDRTGTVLTLIAELIELNQVPVKLTPSLLFRE